MVKQMLGPRCTRMRADCSKWNRLCCLKVRTQSRTASPKQAAAAAKLEEAGRQVHSYFDRMRFACRLARSMNGGEGENVHWVQVSECPTLTHLI